MCWCSGRDLRRGIQTRRLQGSKTRGSFQRGVGWRVRRLLLRMRGGGKARRLRVWRESCRSVFPPPRIRMPFGPRLCRAASAAARTQGKGPLESSSLGALEMKSIEASLKTHAQHEPRKISRRDWEHDPCRIAVADISAKRRPLSAVHISSTRLCLKFLISC